MSQEEYEEVIRNRKGKYIHFCSDWDGLLIDEYSPEFECCGCIKTELKTEE